MVRDEKDEDGKPKWNKMFYLKTYMMREIGKILTNFRTARK